MLLKDKSLFTFLNGLLKSSFISEFNFFELFQWNIKLFITIQTSLLPFKLTIQLYLNKEVITLIIYYFGNSKMLSTNQIDFIMDCQGLTFRVTNMTNILSMVDFVSSIHNPNQCVPFGQRSFSLSFLGKDFIEHVCSNFRYLDSVWLCQQN